MKPKLSKSYEELVRGYYGKSAGLSDEPTTVEELFARYYGMMKTKRAPKVSRKPTMVLSLRCDDGETISQLRKSVALRGTALTKQSSLYGGLNLPSMYDVNPVREYEVDFSPDQPGVTSVTAPQEPKPQTPQGTVRKPQTPPEVPQEPFGARESAGQKEKTARSPSGSSDDEFAADLQDILIGKKVFDPVSGRTVEKDKIGDQREQQNIQPAPPPSSANDGQAIFDRIAQSMQYANAFDLGTVELSNRFDDFDRMADLQRRSSQEKRTNSSQPSPPVPVEQSKSTVKPKGSEFLEDLDAIRSQKVEEKPVPTDIAASFSLTGNLADALYDTGEHVMAAEAMFPDMFLVGKPPGVKFSYGQLIALADMFESVNQLAVTDAEELRKIKALVEQSTRYYKAGKRGSDVSSQDWEKATAGRYLRLAEDNYDHFAPNILFKGAPFAKKTSRYGDHKSAWERHHKWALEEARKDPRIAEPGYFAQWPLMINAFGDHFLTDAFAAGHIVNKEAVIDYYKSSFYSSSSLNADASKFFNQVAAKVFTGDVKAKFSELETYEPYDAWWNIVNWNPNIDTVDAFSSLLKGIAEKEPDRIGNLAIKALHDKLNKDGITVTNDAGNAAWQLTGDGYLTATTLAVMRQAVEQSVANVQDLVIQSNSFTPEPYFAKVWRYVPRLTAASENTIKSLTATYVMPTSSHLVDAAAALISAEVDTLIKVLKDKKVLKKA